MYTSINDLNNNVNAVSPGGFDSLRSTVIISPPDGWGYERDMIGSDAETERRNGTFALARQLGGTRVGIFSDFKYNDGDFIKDTTFRQVGVMQDVEGTKNEDGYRTTVSVYNTVKVYRTTNSDSKSYIIGEMITQGSARGQVVGVDNKTNDIYIKYIQDPYLHRDRS